MRDACLTPYSGAETKQLHKTIARKKLLNFRVCYTRVMTKLGSFWKCFSKSQHFLMSQNFEHFSFIFPSNFRENKKLLTIYTNYTDIFSSEEAFFKFSSKISKTKGRLNRNCRRSTYSMYKASPI